MCIGVVRLKEETQMQLRLEELEAMSRCVFPTE